MLSVSGKKNCDVVKILAILYLILFYDSVSMLSYAFKYIDLVACSFLNVCGKIQIAASLWGPDQFIKFLLKSIQALGLKVFFCLPFFVVRNVQ